MSEQLSRRALLLGGSALAVTAACGGDKDKDLKVSDTTTTQRERDLLQVVQAGFNFQTGIEERLTFALLQGVPPTLFRGSGEVQVAFQKPGTQVLTPPVVAERKSSGIEDRPYYVVRQTLDVPGNWGLQATVAGRRPGNLVFQVDEADSVKWPTPGKALPKTKTPTALDAMGVNPICTRAAGTCPFHAASLDKLLGNGKPTIVLLATPALCKSATCGPVLDILMAETEAHLGALNVVHIEIFTDDTGKTTSPSFAAFNLVNEPVCYFADTRGIVTERFNGAFDHSEAKAAVERLLA
ncbi:MAG TPA: hypothetical protein VMZ22_10705 [Acidimicrobiales bacterium]|nr:hypothetical protein [Acidimicrobiales bacterium]